MTELELVKEAAKRAAHDAAMASEIDGVEIETHPGCPCDEDEHAECETCNEMFGEKFERLEREGFEKAFAEYYTQELERVRAAARSGRSPMKAAEKWVPCTASFPDYDICLGPTIIIRRNRGIRGSYKGKIVAIQHYKNQLWATMYDRFAKARRVNVLDLANWSAAAEWKRKGGKKAEKTVKPKRVAASQPVPAPPPPPKPTREQIRAWMLAIQGDEFLADHIKLRKLAEYKQMLADLAGESGLQLDAVTPTPPASETPINTGAK
jgi:hypothetical protein